MARSLNKVMLIGYTADEPAIRVLDNGAKLAQVTVVTNEGVKRPDGKLEEEPEWNRVVFFLRTRSYTDQAGVKRYITEIIGSNLIMLDSKSEVGGRTAPPFNQTNAFNQKPSFDQKAAFNPANLLNSTAAAPASDADDEPPF